MDEVLVYLSGDDLTPTKTYKGIKESRGNPTCQVGCKIIVELDDHIELYDELYKHPAGSDKRKQLNLLQQHNTI